MEDPEDDEAIAVSGPGTRVVNWKQKPRALLFAAQTREQAPAALGK